MRRYGLLTMLVVALAALPVDAAEVSVQFANKTASIVLGKDEITTATHTQIAALFCRSWSGYAEVQYPMTYTVKRWTPSGGGFVPGPVMLTGTIDHCPRIIPTKPTF